MTLFLQGKEPAAEDTAWDRLVGLAQTKVDKVLVRNRSPHSTTDDILASEIGTVLD